MGRRSLVIGAVLVGLVPAAAQAQQQLIVNDPIESAMIARSDGRDLDPMPKTEERLSVAVDGQHATTTLLQVFQNKTGGQVEGVYRLRPGGGARVEGFAYWNGEDKIIGEVFERAAAKTIYESAVVRKRDPGLLEQEGEGSFSFRVFPIAADEKKRVEIRYSRWLDRQGNLVSYRAPVSSGADIVITIEPGVKIKDVTSTTHELAIEKLKSGGARVRASKLKKDAKAGEIDLQWEVHEKAWTPSAYVHWDGQNDGFFAVALPAPDVTEEAVSKDVTIVIDRSGSMAGTSLQNAKAAAADVVRRLDDDDRVNVIAFSDEVDPLFSMPQTANEANRKQAISFIERMTDGGGTDIALALKTAFKAQDDDEDRPRVVIFMTDGQSDPKAATAEVEKDKHDVRLFTVGLGDGVEKPLLSRLSAMKRGRFTFIAGADAIKRDVGTLYAQISKPLLVNIELSVDGINAKRLYPRTLPDLFAKDQLLVTGRFNGGGTATFVATFVIKGRLAGHDVSYTAKAKIDGAVSRPWVGRLWAQSRVDHLLEEIALAGGSDDEMSEEVIDLAVTYNFVTPYTSFLAIPESELNAAAKTTIENARDRKRRLMQQNPDAEVDKEVAEKADKDVDKAQQVIVTAKPPGGTVTGGKGTAAPSPAKPAPDRPMAPPPAKEPPDVTVSGTTTIQPDYTRNVPTNGRTYEGQVAQAPGAQGDTYGTSYGGEDTERAESESGGDEEDMRPNAPTSAPGSAQKSKGGCAGCATTSSGSDLFGSFLLAGLTLILLRRRRPTR